METYPPIGDGPTINYRQGQLFWHELATTDIDKARSFYGGLFGWTFEDISEEYVIIRHGGENIGGMVSSAASGKSMWIGAVSVEETQKAVDFLKSVGAEVLVGTTKLSGRGTMALFRDPQGAPVSLVHSSVGDPPLLEAKTNEWLWMELWSDDPPASAEFYGKTLGYASESIKIDDRDYWIFSKDEVKVGGISSNPVTNMETQWVPYIKVSDPVRMTARAKELGANVLLEPDPSIRKGTVAVMTDPTGAIFCIQQWPVN